MNKKFPTSLIFMVLILLGVVMPVYGQESDYSVHMRRDFGYGGGSNIRGTFTISLVGAEERVGAVTFLMDGEPMATIREAPFTFKFHTDDYGFGIHRLSAEVNLQGGSIQTTSALQYNFVSPTSEREQVTTLLVGIGGAVVVTLLIVGAVQTLFIRRKANSPRQPGEPREYGLLGGTICTKCGRPFPRHIWGINLMVGKLDRCDNCGKWVMTVRATPEAIRLAEEGEQEAVHEDKVISTGKTDPTDDLEDTKYFDDL